MSILWQMIAGGNSLEIVRAIENKYLPKDYKNRLEKINKINIQSTKKKKK